MDNIDLKTFTTRITQANKSELVVIIYDIIMKDIEGAQKAFAQSDETMYTREVNHAVKLVNELINTLDFSYPISYDLMQLYLYCNKQLILTTIKKDVQPLSSVYKVLESLRTGFKGVANQDDSEPLMSNTQQVYAGLTYSKNQLNETYIDANQVSRGFKA